MGIIGWGSSGGESCLWVLAEGIQEDIGKQVAKLVSNNVILLSRHKLDECLAAWLGYDHADILFDDQHLIALLDGLMRLTEDLLRQQMRQSHRPHVINIYALLYLQALQFGEEFVLVFLRDQHLLTTSVDDKALKLFLHGLSGTLLDFTNAVLQLASYVVFLTDFYLELQDFFVLGATHSGYFWEVFSNIFP